MHLGDFDPDRPGLECFMIHEASPYGHNYRDAGTGEVLLYSTSSGDNGRGVCADVLAQRGAEFWSANVANTYNIDGSVVSNNKPSMNYRIFWDGDEYEELLNSTSITKWSPSGSKTLGIYTINSTTEKSFSYLDLTPSSCNGTKATPCLQADILGDWREEVIWWNKNNPGQIYLVSTTAITKYRVPTLMHDHLYRMGIAWQNVGYNQPPHLGYYLPDYVKSFAGVPDDACNGVQHLAHAPKIVKEQTCYNINGQQVKCAPSQRSMYIVKKTFNDNTISIEKHIK